MVNPIAGRRSAHRVLAEVVRRLRGCGMVVEVERTRGCGHARRWAGTLDPGTDAVVVVGGDGTIREVIDGLAGRPVPLVVLPTGTENLIAKAFDFRFDAQTLCHRLQAGMPRKVDVGVLNGQHFLAVVGVGFDAEAVERLRNGRSGHITYLDYFGPLWRTFWEHRFPPLHVEADGENVHDGPALAFAANLRQYALGLPICPDARADDGLLDLCVFSCASHGQLIRHSMRTVLNRHVNAAGVVHRKCSTIRITSPQRVPVESDGDAAGVLPVEITVQPDHATFLAL